MAFYLYILQSQSTEKLYIGQTNDLEDRLHRHNSDRNNYTKGKGPWILLFSKEFGTRSEAMLMESKLKSWKNPTKVKQWIASERLAHPDWGREGSKFINILFRNNEKGRH